MRKLIIILFVLHCILFASSPVFADISTAVDPTRLGVGARPLGMGKAFVGLASGIESIFLNPSGLADLQTWEATSMYGKFVDEVSYISLGYAFPTRMGTFAIGLINAGLSINTPLAEIEVVDGEIRIIPSTTESTTYNYGNGVMLLSYANRLFNNLYLGGNLKLFQTSLTGFGATSADSARGQDLDLSLKFRPGSFYSLGVDLQNILPYDMGGQLTYGDGYKESIGSVIKVGGSFQLMGPKPSLFTRPYLLTLNTDCDLSLKKIPSLFHTGLEFWPIPLLALRAGVDQDLVGVGSFANNFTAGVGIKAMGFRFDLAYHEYNNVPQNTTYYFSLTYSPIPAAKKPSMPPPSPFEWIEPKDKTYFPGAKIKVRGSVLDLVKVKELKVNGLKTTFSLQGSFEAEIPLTKTQNKIVVEAFDQKGQSLKKEERKVIKIKTYPDVPMGYWAKTQIDLLTAADIAMGYPDGTFRPEQVITKAELVSFAIRARNGMSEVEESRVFKDVPTNYWAARYINRAKRLNLIKSYRYTFDPEKKLTRAEGVALMVDILEIPLPQKITECPYLDVPGRHEDIGAICAAQTSGMLQYIGAGPFEPERGLTRALAVEFLSRAPKAKDKIENMWKY